MLAEAIYMEFVGPVKEHKGVILVSSAYRIVWRCCEYVINVYDEKQWTQFGSLGTPVSMLAREDVTPFI